VNTPETDEISPIILKILNKLVNVDCPTNNGTKNDKIAAVTKNKKNIFWNSEKFLKNCIL
jgi:hypothetical protein